MKSQRNVAASLALACTASIAAMAQMPGSAPAPAPAGPPAVKLPLTSLVPDATVAIAGGRRLAGSDDAVWVITSDSGTLTRVDTKANTPGAPVLVGSRPCADPLVAFKSVWVAECGLPALARLHLDAGGPPAMFTTTIRGVGPMVSGVSSVWMIADPAGTLLRVDPDTNRAVAEIFVPGGAQTLAFAEDAVWIAGTTQATVTRLNAHTNVVGASARVGRGPVVLASGEGAVWALNTGDGTVSRIDPKTARVTATVTLGVPVAGGAIAAGEHGVWISAEGAPLVRIDPVTNLVSHVFAGPGGGAVTVAAGAVWVAATPTDIWRVDPRRVEATRTSW